MMEISTKGTICLKDDYGIEYKISEIEYIENKDETFKYIFRPCYEVIDMLGPELFQGIPGLNLDIRQPEYIRDNIIPTFISERTPGPNRENLQEMIEEVDMKYLNQLEWLIRTDTQYSGDRLYVKRYTNTDKKQTVEITLSQTRALQSCRQILDIVCYGNDISGDGFQIDSTNRNAFYKVLYTIYSNEVDDRKKKISEGIRRGAEKGHYKGRVKKQVNIPKLYEINDNLLSHRISVEEATRILGISRATLYRRLKEIRK